MGVAGTDIRLNACSEEVKEGHFKNHSITWQNAAKGECL